MNSIRLIAKQQLGKYRLDAEMYMKLLPDDGKILQHLQINFYTVKDFINVLPGHRLLHHMPEENGALKKHWYTLLMMNGYFRTKNYVSHLKKQQNLTGFD